MTQILLKSILAGCFVFTIGIIADTAFQTRVIINDAEARVGRPLTPVSVRGVARRTTRRAIRKAPNPVYVVTLPPDCITVVIEGTKLHQCGTTYYKLEGSQYVVVVVD